MVIAYALLILLCLNSPYLFDRVVLYVLCTFAAVWVIVFIFPGDSAFAMEYNTPGSSGPEGHSTSTFSQNVADVVTWLKPKSSHGSVAPVLGMDQVLAQSGNVHNENAGYVRELNQSVQNLLVKQGSSNMDELRDRVTDANSAASGVTIYQNPDIAFAQGRSYEASRSTDALRALQHEQASIIARKHVAPTSGYGASAMEAFGQGLGTVVAEELTDYAGRVSTGSARAAQQPD